MREKRVNFVVLTCSVLVATCASLSYCFVTADNHRHLVDKYVAVISRAIPLFLSGHISTASAATVWIPTDDAENTDGSVKDEFQEVAHVFARPEAKVVKPRDEDEITHQAVPWTSLKNEWKIYQKIQSSQRKGSSGENDDGSKKEDEQVADDDDDEGSSEEEDDGEDEDEEDEEDEPEGRSGIVPPLPRKKVVKEATSEERTGPLDAPTAAAKKLLAQAKKDNLPLAFYGQENHDDDEKEYLKNEAKVFSKKKRSKKGKDNDEDAKDDDGDVSKEEDLEDYDMKLEDLNDYEVEDDDEVSDDDADADDDGDEDDDEGKQQKKKDVAFHEIPLAIREMILNDLANQNNGSGYHPNLTPQVTGGHQGGPPGGPQEGQGGSSGSAENDDENSGEDNSSEEEEDDNESSAAEIAEREAAKLGDSEPTPPPVRPPVKQKKGDDDEDDDDINDDDDGGKKKSKGKKKKGKKGKKGGGWGKPKGWGWQPPVIHHPPKEHGWGWDPSKHNGLLEQLVKGSTWENVLKYYHWKRDQSIKEEGEHHDDHHGGHHDHGHGGGHHGGHGGHHDHHDHGPEHGEQPGLELGGGWGPEPPQGDGKIKKIVKGAFKGSFWERAVHTYAKYKENQAKNPKKPTLLDLDADNLHLGR